MLLIHSGEEDDQTPPQKKKRKSYKQQAIKCGISQRPAVTKWKYTEG